jgi:hypothetical protein
MRMILISVRIGMAVMVLSPYILIPHYHYHLHNVSECLLGWLVSAHFYVCKCLLVSVYLL